MNRLNKIIKDLGNAYLKHENTLLKMKTCPNCQFEAFKDGKCEHCGYLKPKV